MRIGDVAAMARLPSSIGPLRPESAIVTASIEAGSGEMGTTADAPSLTTVGSGPRPVRPKAVTSTPMDNTPMLTPAQTFETCRGQAKGRDQHTDGQYADADPGPNLRNLPLRFRYRDRRCERRDVRAVSLFLRFREGIEDIRHAEPTTWM
jgi:hypothetical protein